MSMQKKLSMVVFMVLLFCTFTTLAQAFEIPRQSPALPAAAKDLVQRTLLSKPGDCFVVLKNGLTVLLRSQTGMDVASAQVFVRAGSIYEGKYATAGISHYLEHVLSGGSTRSFTETEAKERLERIGGATNASTSFDRTVYYINTSTVHWKEALDLLLSYVSESTLDPQQVLREKAVIQQEIKMGENDPGNQLWKLFMKTAYRVSPARIPVIGYEEVFVKLDRDALEDYYLQRYQPENIVVVLAGNVAPGEALQFIAEKTKDFTRKAQGPVVVRSEPDQVSPRWEEKTLPLARLTQAMLGFPSVNLYSKDLYALDVLAILLGEGETSRLHHRLRDKENKVLSVSASNWTPSFVEGQFMISLTLDPRHWPGILGPIEEEISRLKKDLVAPEELEKAKKLVLAQHIFGKEAVSALASSLASSYMETGDPYFDEKYVEGIRKVSREGLREAARRYLLMDRSNVAVIKPETPPEAVTQTEAGPSNAAANSRVNVQKLNNGLKVLLKQDCSLPLVTIQLYGLGGLLLEDLQKPGLSSFTASLIAAGTRTRSKDQIAQAIEGVGGMLDNKSDSNTYHLSIKVLKDDFHRALTILADLVQNAQFPPEEIEKRRKETLLAIRKLDENWQTEVMRLFKKNYFLQSPYQNDRLGTFDSVRSFTREDLLTFYRRMVNPHHSVLAIYGDIDEKKTLATLNQNLATWNARPLVLAEQPEETHPLKADRTVEKKNEKTNCALFLGTDGMSLNNPRRPVLDMLDAVLSGTGYPGGRLFEALRGGKEDLVYVVGAFPFYGIRAGFFGVITQTTLKNLERVQEIVLSNLKRLSEEPVPTQELQNAKDMMSTMHQLGLETLGAQARSAAVNEVLGLGWDYDQRYTGLIKAVTAEEIQDLARELFAKTLITRTVPEHPEEVLSADVPSGNNAVQH
jgi:zinc protease